jgi:PAS domain S-box-containing protein
MALAMLASIPQRSGNTMHRAEIDSIYESAHIGLCVIGTDYRFRRINKLLAQINGFPVEAHIGRSVREIIPSLADQAEEIIDSIVRTGQPRLNVEFVGETVVEPGRKRHWLEQWSPLKDESGKVTAVNVVVEDITERKQHEKELQILTREIAHRAKNLLSVVQAIIRQTAQRAVSIEDFMVQVDGRIAALSRAHDLLIQKNWQGADLSELIISQLEPFTDATAQRVTRTGPRLIVCAQATQHLALAIHELATNASKHGALSVPTGTVSIEWSLDNRAGGAEGFSLHWSERGGPAVRPPDPARLGFGMLVLQKLVPSGLHARAEIDYAQSGLRWTLYSDDAWFCRETK